MKIRQLPLLFLLAQPILVNAAIYQWVDEKGVTIYSQTPPTSGEARTINHKSKPIDQAAKQRLLNMQQKVADRQEDRSQQKEKLSKKKAETKRKNSNCTAATSNLSKLISLGNRRYGDERLTEEQRQEKMAKAQKNMTENCRK
jgi:hypothetical protein